MFESNSSMKILTISGSARDDSSNIRLLDALPLLFPEHQVERYKKLDQLPLFTAEADNHVDPPAVQDWKNMLTVSDALLISTPEYIHNLPALLKNALEWLTTSGELVNKKVLVITFTPNPPRGEKAMQSLIWSLQALDANILVQLPLYQNEISFNSNNELVVGESVEMLRAAVDLL